MRKLIQEIHNGKNIKENLKYKNKGNIFNYVKGKQAVWMKLYFAFPKLTCLLRNCLNVGI